MTLIGDNDLAILDLDDEKQKRTFGWAASTQIFYSSTTINTDDDSEPESSTLTMNYLEFGSMETMMTGAMRSGSKVVSFTNPLAAGSGLVERIPKKVGF